MDLRKHVLDYVKLNRRYYAAVSNSYLNKKKLDLVTWLSSMLVRKLPVDELCLHAIAMYLNIHITVDYHGSFWSTLDIPNIHHDLAVVLSDIHHVYCGFCKYNLLCKNTALGSVGRKLMIHKTTHFVLPEGTLVLCRVEEWNPIAGKLINEVISKLNLSNQDDNVYLDGTEIYDIHENVIRTIYYPLEDNSTNARTRTPPNSLLEIKGLSYTHLLFKCPHSKCNTRAHRQKENSDHYRAMHKKPIQCKICRKSYTT